MAKPKNDLTGRTFGEWEVISYEGDGGKWNCKCSCGKLGKIYSNDLMCGKSTSCGHTRNLDITGKTFGEWVVLYKADGLKWRCKCSCGVEKDIDGGHLRGGYTKSCGHKLNRLEDLTGKQFGSLTVLSYAGDKKWYCRCSCGKEISVLASSIKSGHTKSCGHATTGFKDMKGSSFYDIEVIRYVGNDTWQCKCSCGKIFNTSGKRIRSGGIKSCGCKNSIYTLETMLQRYGETSASKITNSRTAEQIMLAQSKENLIGLINGFEYKPTISELCEQLNLGRSSVCKLVKKYNLSDSIKLNPNRSWYEEHIIRFLLSIHPDIQIERGNRSILSGKELDIYIPSMKLAIEFNGDYWHSDKFIAKNYHQNKTLACIKQGIRLIHIFEYEWEDEVKREKIKDILRHCLSTSDKRVMARKTEIKQISLAEANMFLNKYHLQGKAISNMQLGCFLGSDLIGVMTFGKPRFNKEYDFELIRFAWKSNILVVGGAEKLFNAFKNKVGDASVVSYCNIAKFSGTVYTKLGFKESGVTEPNYVWVNITTNDILTRYKTQKHKLVRKNLGNENETENEIMSRLGYLKVFDCGNTIYIQIKDRGAK